MALATAVMTADYPTQMYIDGPWCDALDGKTLAVINPADESVLAEVAYGRGPRPIGPSPRRSVRFRPGVPCRFTIVPRSSSRRPT